MKPSHRLLLAITLLPPWVVLLLTCYWWFIDIEPPLLINYIHPYFTAKPVESRVQAAAEEIREVVGSQEVYAYYEFCITKTPRGNARAIWDAGTFVWPTLERSLIGSSPGCYTRSGAVRTPDSAVTRDFKYLVTREYEVNPLRTISVVDPPILLRIIAK
jgi:hypothetical protein